MDSDLYREKAEESGAYLLRAMLTSIVRQEIFNPGAVDKCVDDGTLRAMLTSIVRQEIFNPGAVDKCVDDGTVYVLLEEMKKKNVYR